MANSASSNELHSITKHNNIVISGVGANEVLKFDGSNWINQTLAESGIAPVASPTFTTGATSPAWITGNSGTIKLVDGDGNHFTTIAAHATTVADVAYTWPNNAPSTSGFALTSTTGGEMSWAAAGGDFSNGGDNGALVLGTNDANSLTFETNNTTRMTIESGGDIGIGITNPTTRLQINGPDDTLLYLTDAATWTTLIGGLTDGGQAYSVINTVGSFLRLSVHSVVGLQIGYSGTDSDVTVKENNSMPSVTKGIAKHWVRFNPTSTGTLIASYNTSSVTDTNVGNWTVVLNTHFENGVDCVIVGQTQGTSGGHKGITLDGVPATSEYYIGCFDDTDTRSDPDFVHMVAFGEAT